MVASKFLNDEGEEDEVFNSDWANSAKIDLKELNQLERKFLTAIVNSSSNISCQDNNNLVFFSPRIGLYLLMMKTFQKPCHKLSSRLPSRRVLNGDG